MRRIHGPVQHYAWGDTTFIPELLGAPVDGRPWAELWLGTHPAGPARFDDGKWLESVTGELPYLLKVLAAAEPLSLQTHPNAAQALDGYARGVFADDQPKPELLCALTPFYALCGIRPVDQTLLVLDMLGIHDLARVLTSSGPAGALEAIYRGQIDIAAVVERCAVSVLPEARLVTDLAARYPDDPSVAVTLLLNHVTLEPGQTIRLDAGSLHAYIRGAGIELMGASDNVVRGGLTTKPVDVDQLLAIVDTTPMCQPTIRGQRRFELPDARVALLFYEAGTNHHSRGHEVAIDLDGGSWYLAPDEEVTWDAPTYVVTYL